MTIQYLLPYKILKFKFMRFVSQLQWAYRTEILHDDAPVYWQEPKSIWIGFGKLKMQAILWSSWKVCQKTPSPSLNFDGSGIIILAKADPILGLQSVLRIILILSLLISWGGWCAGVGELSRFVRASLIAAYYVVCPVIGCLVLGQIPLIVMHSTFGRFYQVRLLNRLSIT